MYGHSSIMYVLFSFLCAVKIIVVLYLIEFSIEKVCKGFVVSPHVLLDIEHCEHR